MGRRIVFAVVLSGFCTAASVVAQPAKIDVEGFYGFASTTGVDGSHSPLLDYRSIANYGGGVNLRWMPQFSTSLTVSTANPSLRLGNSSEFADFLTFGTVRTTPLALVAQWHFLGLRAIDPYVGVGAAWVFASNASLYPYVVGATNVAGVDFDDKIAFVADTGVRFNVFGPVGFLFDARYMPLDLDATVRFKDGAQSAEVSVKSNQFLVGFGVSVRF
jgi:outer membrane protein W